MDGSQKLAFTSKLFSSSTGHIMREVFFFPTSPISWLWGSSRTIHEEKLYRRSKWHSAVLILKPTDLGHFTVLSPIYPVGQISSLNFQQKRFRNSIASDSNLAKELKYALLLIAVKTLAKLYSKKKNMYHTLWHLCIYSICWISRYQDISLGKVCHLLLSCDIHLS